MNARAFPASATFATTIVAAILALSSAGLASAQDLCAAADLPVGAEVHGPVLQVLDGERLCVALDFEHWVALDVGHGDATGSSRGVLMAAAFAQTADCRVTATLAGRTLASCRIDGHDLEARLADPHIVQAGMAWR